ncbi:MULTISPECIES: hypothetical protein [Dyadobacter]|uniref:Extracellular endo-alpha-(1->5)-L-arabinanase C-terminal domain-containing protein n=1 Tax=Dyadobacter chenhuakuii TaxID=2909339 RepID=A0ABY4XGN2_9BACT|nr:MULTISPECIES: hypothetical protein [Dyadobacter]MCE7069033.1 hypothetical protein [Dyadobacter sp. CY327]MCF2495431.1 hypothetical protein [Dyadobacter chenhuakuii]MCF2520338.1 hypothetical protein [Dyadobacter sp. CY351]USJ29469.1 hypothetical protein NFI80_16470 [Dyadobacter chenhuakuii]
MKTKLYFMMVIALGIFSIAAQKSVTADDILGTWKYQISDVPPEYESGFFTFEQKDNKTVGYVGDTQKQEMKELTVAADKVTFSTESDQGVFKYNLALKGDTLTGMISSQYGDFPIKAVKEAKK